MFLYRLLLLLLTPPIFLHLLWRAFRCGEWRYFAQRIGREYDEVPQGCVWVHCASVGETRSMLQLLEQLHATCPHEHFVLSSNTATSRRIVQHHGADWITHLYCPIDWRLSVRAFLQHVQPRRCYLFETELWPNLITACSQRGIPVGIINGRISDTTMRRAWLLRRIYAQPLAAVDSIRTRNDEDRSRYIELGAAAASTTVAGDLKLAQGQSSRHSPQDLTARPYILVVSTHDDEEQQIAEQCRPLLDDYLLVIAPRHPERGDAVANRLHKLGMNIAMHTHHDRIDDDTDVYIIDAIGLLDGWFPAATCVVMGGTFSDIGGHNLMEPLAYGCAVAYGPSMHNFIEMNALVLEHQAAVQLASVDELGSLVQDWIHDKATRSELSQRALSLSESLNATLDEYSSTMSKEICPRD